MYVGVICTHCIRSESQLSISVRPSFAMGNTVCLFNLFPQQWKKDAISVEATYILVNAIRQFSIVIQSHESSLPPLEKIKEMVKRTGESYLPWSCNPIIYQCYHLCMTGPWCLRFSIPPHRKFITADIQQCSLHYQLINDSDWITYQATQLGSAESVSLLLHSLIFFLPYATWPCPDFLKFGQLPVKYEEDCLDKQ